MPKSKITIEIQKDVDVRELTIRITPSQIELSTDTRLSESLGGSGEKEKVRRYYESPYEALQYSKGGEIFRGPNNDWYFYE